MGDVISFSKCLKYYKRPEVQDALVAHAEHREVSPRYGSGFGKRPDIVQYPSDILSFVTKKATSFHSSEERWRDPLAIRTGMSRRELDDLRIGWDLVLDIDCPFWDFAKLTAALFIKALRDHGVKSITCKFSGNKGFHIGVPFESFPEFFNNHPVKSLFPEAPRAIADYLLNFISDHYVKVVNNTIFFGNDFSISFSELKALVGGNKLLIKKCSSCGRPRSEVGSSSTFVCPSCQYMTKSVDDYLKCPRCSAIMERFDSETSCSFCGSSGPPVDVFNVASLIEVDTILLASRHLFRMPYSLHEKSGLASVVIDADSVLSFSKESAIPENVTNFSRFLSSDGVVRGEASDLLFKAMSRFESLKQDSFVKKDYEPPDDLVPEEFFPPCIKNIFSGLVDGKKRALFILTNFLKTCGWPPEMIKDRIYEWNKQNPDRLRETIIKSHLTLKAKKGELILPPNCSSDYYKALGVCRPDDLCRTIRNPTQYAIKKMRFSSRQKTKRVRKKLPDKARGEEVVEGSVGGGSSVE